MAYTLEWILNHEESYRYMMLGRMQSDCEFYLGWGHRNSGRLWAKDVKKHIRYMKAIWESFPEDKKPVWLTWEQILDYETKMCNDNNIGGSDNE